MADGSRGRPPGQSPISPRVKLAARLYASGAVATKVEASEAAGLHPSYFTLITSPGNTQFRPEVAELMDEIDQQIHDKTVDMSTVLQAVGREALSRMRGLMKESRNEAIVVKAAADLLDRSPETSKIQKHQVASFAVSGDDAKLLASAMVRSAQARAQFAEVTQSDFVRVPLGQNDLESTQDNSPNPDGQSNSAQRQEGEANAGQGLQRPSVGQVDEGTVSSASGLDGQGTCDEPASTGQAEVGPASEESAAERPVSLRLIKGDDL